MFDSIKKNVTSTAIQGGVLAAQAVGTVALNVEAELKIQQAKTCSKEIAELSKRLPGKIGRMVAQIAIAAQNIIQTVEKDPRDFKVIRSFFDYNLGKAKEVIEARVAMLDSKTDEIAHVDGVIGEILENFNDFLRKCAENDVQGAAISAESLSRIMKANI